MANDRTFYELYGEEGILGNHLVCNKCFMCISCKDCMCEEVD